MKPASDIGLYFDSWDEIFKKPFGAIERNSKVDFKICETSIISFDFFAAVKVRIQNVF